MSLSGGLEDNREHNIIKTTTRDISDDEGPLCTIKFLEGGAEIICGSTVAGGARFCMTRVEDCTTASHTRFKGLSEELLRDK